MTGQSLGSGEDAPGRLSDSPGASFPTREELNEALWNLPEWLVHPVPYLEFHRSDNYVVLDFETTSLDKGDPRNPDNRLLLACWRCGPEHPRAGNHYRWGSEYEQGRLLEDIEAADFVVAHNAKFEIGWLKRCGLEPHKYLWFCTQIAEYCIAGNRSSDVYLGKSWALDLASCARRRRLPVEKDWVGELIRMGVPTELIPPSWLLAYCQTDVLVTLALFQKQQEMLIRDSLEAVFFTRMLLTPVLSDIESRGIQLDPARVDAVHRRFAAELAEAEADLERITGGINWRSPKQKQEFIFDTLGFAFPTDSRKRPLLTPKAQKLRKEGLLGEVTKSDISTDKTALSMLRATTRAQKEFVDALARANAAGHPLSKYLRKFKSCCERVAGRLIGNLNQTRTATHRLSSTGVTEPIQFQNFDNRFKPLITVRDPAYEYADADFAQLEFRIAGILGGDIQVHEDVAAGHDCHAYTASIIFAEEWDADRGAKEGANKGLRTKSKAHTFKPLYGGTSGSQREQAYYRAFQERYNGVTGAQQEWIQEALETGQVTTATGLRLYYPGTRVTDSGFITNSTNISDHPVQMLATADLSPTATVYLWHLMRVFTPLSFINNMVHDSTTGEIHREEKEAWKVLVDYCYVTLGPQYIEAVYGIEMTMPMEAETEFATHWGDSEAWQEKWLNGNI